MKTLTQKEKPKLVVVPTADGKFWAEDLSHEISETIARWELRGFTDIQILHAKESGQVTEDFVSPLKETDCVWIAGGVQSRLRDVYKGSLLEAGLIEFLNRNGVLGATSAGTAICSEVMIAGGRDVAHITDGFSILRNTICDTHYHERKRDVRLKEAISRKNAKYGLGISEQTAVVIDLKNELSQETMGFVGDPGRLEFIVNSGYE